MRSPGYSSCSVCPPVWVLDGLLRFRIFSFEPLSSSPLRILMKLVLIFRYLGCGVVVACLLHTQEVPGSIPGRGSYLRQVSLH